MSTEPQPTSSPRAGQILDVSPVWLVSDVEASCEELRDLLDFTISPYFAPPGEGAVYGIVEREGAKVHLGRPPDRVARPGRPHKREHCDAYLYVVDVDALHAQVVERGGTVLQAPRVMPYGIREMHVGLRDGFVLALGEVVD